MSKLSISATIAIVLSCLFGVFTFQESASLKDLTGWSISADPIEPKDSKVFVCRDQYNFGRKTAFLRNYNSTNVVAVIVVEGDGTVLLNPRNQIGTMKYNYGPIPKLEHISKKQLDALWKTKSLNPQGSVVTYEFNVGRQNKGERKQVFIDTVFFSKKLVKYRIRSRFINSTDWINV